MVASCCYISRSRRLCGCGFTERGRGQKFTCDYLSEHHRIGDPGSATDGDRGPQGIAGAAGPPGPLVAGATYVRWGRTTCPTGNGTELLYAGRAASPNYGGMGGGLLCLPDNPEYLGVNSPSSGNPILSGVEFHSDLDNLNM